MRKLFDVTVYPLMYASCASCVLCCWEGWGGEAGIIMLVPVALRPQAVDVHVPKLGLLIRSGVKRV